ncbi:hypothetical protein [Candidatus Alkanophaga liquidiphilum]|nr:hypothetical protein [Candidatus Alkanophaga liquidiphilum]
MIELNDFKYGMLFGFVGFALTLVSMYFATGMFDPRFSAVIGAGLFWRISWFIDKKIA